MSYVELTSIEFNRVINSLISYSGIVTIEILINLVKINSKIVLMFLHILLKN